MQVDLKIALSLPKELLISLSVFHSNYNWAHNLTVMQDLACANTFISMLETFYYLYYKLFRTAKLNQRQI